MKRDDIDAAIDAAVRDIMRAEPPPGLRSRVMRRLAEPPRDGLFTVPRLVLATLCAGAVTIGVAVLREHAPAPAPSPAASAVVAASRPEPPAVQTPTPAERPVVTDPPHVARVAEASPARATTRAGERLVQAASVVNVEPTVTIAPLAAPAPIEIALLDDLAPLSLREITIRPLQMEPVRIDPLPTTPR